MRFYRISIEGSTENIRFEPTLKLAHIATKTHYTPWLDMTFIDEVEVKTDKHSVTELVRGGSPIVTKVLRTWAVTARGGLKETNNVAVE